VPKTAIHHGNIYPVVCCTQILQSIQSNALTYLFIITSIFTHNYSLPLTGTMLRVIWAFIL